MEKQNNNDNASRITDKAFSRAMITSVLGILVCITCLCSATWAWFSTDISNDSNTVGSGNFGLIVTVVDVTDGGSGESTDVPVSVTADGDSVCTLTGGRTYKVTLKMTADTTVTKGFCNIRSGANPTVALQSGSVNVDEGTDPFEFTLTVGGTGERSVTFEPAWGYPANAKVEHLGTLAIS